MNDFSQALPIMVNNYSKLFGIIVKMQGSVAYTNGKEITIPRLDINDPVKSRLAYGYLAHEAAHIRYTNFKLLNEDDLANDYLAFTLFNILEDSRIEALIAKEYIGVYENLYLLNNYYQKEWDKFCNILDTQQIFTILSSFIQAYSQVYCQKFASSRKRAAVLLWHLRHRIEKPILSSISKVVRQCAKAQDSEEILDRVKELIELIKQLDFLKELSNKKIKPLPKPQRIEDEFSCFDSDPNVLADTILDREDPQKFRDKKDKDLGSKDYISILSQFREFSEQDPSNATPSRSIKSIVEENSNSQNSTTREDFGAFKENICEAGRSNFLDTIADTYALRNMLQQRVRAYVEAYGSSTIHGSKIDPLKAQKVAMGQMDIFKDKILQTGFSTSVHILVDVSSSMLSSDGNTHTRAEEACKVALMLCTALEGIDGIKVLATFFPGIATEFEIALSEKEKASRVAPRFDQRPRGSTPLAQALWYAFDKVKTLECNRNIVLVITDGMPDSVSNAQNCFSYAKENHIDIYGISIRSEIILKLFEKAQVIEGANELKEKAFSLVNSLFKVKTNFAYD